MPKRVKRDVKGPNRSLRPTKGFSMNINSDQAKGKLKEAVGALTDDERLKKEGKADQLVGDAKGVIQDVADKADEVIDDIKKAAHRD